MVSVLFCDVVGSTALGESTDPEALRALLARYFERMRGIVESHEGSVEKFIGDAVMAVFGVPVVHEDDALRACRAALEMREAFAGLGIEGRIGISTGEVVTGTEERLATGDALNVAARLQQAAQPGAVLIAEATLRLVGEAVDVEPIGPIGLKGKSEPVAAFRLLAARAASERRHDTVFVGRGRELRLLGEAWEQAVAEKRSELVTVVGEAGIGKSRLAAEALATIEARVVRGRCLPYGAGITYWPVVEVVKQLDVLPSDPAAAAAIRSLLGESQAGTSAEEIAWAFRKLLEEQAPLVVVFDDIQWGEETFLDLVEHVALLSSGAPLLLLCMARPELLDGRPSWPVTVRLAPLDEEDVSSLIGADVAGELRARIAAAAAGNPLFIGEMLAMTQEVSETGDGVVVVPPTLKALLTARLDQLVPAERRVLERGAVEGEVFHRGAVQALAPEEQQVTPRLAALVRRELIRPDTAQFTGEDGFRFRHLLIRDAAYDALPKATRAELHERFSGWVGEHGRDLVEVDEVVGYHLEQAHRYLCELGPADAHTHLLAQRAAERLSSAGRRANTRGDLRAAIALLERAAPLLAKDDPRRPLLLAELGIALAHAKELERAEAVVTEAVEAAGLAGDSQTQAHAMLAFLEVKWRREGMTAKIEEETGRAIRIFEQFDDERGLARALHLMSRAYEHRFETIAKQDALGRALRHARNAGDTQQEAWLRIVFALALLEGPAPLAEVSRYNQENLAWARASHNPRVEASALVLGGQLRAMQGDFVEARALVARGRALFEELGVKIAVVGCFSWSGEVEELAGDLAAAEAELRAGLQFCEETGDRRQLQDFAFGIARLADRQGHYAEAESLLSIDEEPAESDDRWLQVDWRCWRARIMARQGQMEEAVRLANEAVALAAPPEAPLYRAFWLLDAATVILLAGRFDEAISLAEEALTLYERKGNLVMAARVRDQLAELQGTAPR